MIIPVDIQQLQQYITESLAHGYTREQVINALQQAGWPVEIINRAFIQERAMSVPPAPVPDAQRSSHTPIRLEADLLKKPLVRDLSIAFVFAVVMAIVFKLLLPPPEDQAIYDLSAALSGSLLPAGIFPVMITTVVAGAVYALILKFALKYKGAFGIILVGLAGSFLALIAEQDRVIGWGFILGLLVTYPLAQLAAYYANKLVVLRIVYVAATVVLMVLSMRVLNLGHL